MINKQHTLINQFLQSDDLNGFNLLQRLFMYGFIGLIGVAFVFHMGAVWDILSLPVLCVVYQRYASRRSV